MIIDKTEFDFSDEVVVSFALDTKLKQMCITFDSYYRNDEYIELPCHLLIQNWSEGKSRAVGKDKYGTLESNIGVPSLLLSSECKVNEFVICINTTDDRYVELHFIGAKLKVCDPSSSDYPKLS